MVNAYTPTTDEVRTVSAEPRLNTMRSTDDGETWQWVHTTPAAEGDGRAEQ